METMVAMSKGGEKKKLRRFDPPAVESIQFVFEPRHRF
jgi:hypothetical protein